MEFQLLLGFARKISGRLSQAPAVTRTNPRRSAIATLSLWYSRALSVLLVLSVAALVVPVTLQIFSRYTTLVPFYIWTEEMARFVFIWMIMLGAALGIRESTHFVVDVWPRLGPRPNALFGLLSSFAILIMALVFTWWGWEFTRFAFRRISELAELPLWWIHIAWPMTGLSWLLFQGEHVADHLRTLMRGSAA
jgi:TRAP-type C4-dicarboxylate transport system permease small subunit